MKVRAKELGFDGFCRRRPGDVFELKDPKNFSKSWMEKIDDNGRVVRPTKSPASAPESVPATDDVI